MLRKQKKWCFILLSMIAFFVFAADDDISFLSPFTKDSEKSEKSEKSERGSSGSQASRARKVKRRRSSSSRKSSKREKIRQKLKGIVKDRINFEDVPMTTAILYLQSVSKEEDPERVGINIKFQGTVDDDFPMLTFIGENISLESVIKHICRTTQCTYQITDDGVIIRRRR